MIVFKRCYFLYIFLFYGINMVRSYNHDKFNLRKVFLINYAQAGVPYAQFVISFEMRWRAIFR